MIEGIKVITGTPEEVEKKLGKFLASHEKATVLSSSVTVHCEQPPAVTDDKAKAKAAAPAHQTTVCVIAGLQF